MCLGETRTAIRSDPFVLGTVNSAGTASSAGTAFLRENTSLSDWPHFVETVTVALASAFR